MRFLIMDGCPRKNNTWKIVQIAVEQIKKLYPDSEFEEICLINEKLPFCTGCSNCFRLGHEKCPHYSIVGNIIEKLDQADGVIVCSTTYNWKETSILKNLLDHFCFMLHRPHFYREKALVITTTGGTGGSKSAKSIASTLGGIGFNRCYQLSFGAISWNAYEPKVKAKLKTQKIAERFAKDVHSGKLYSPPLMLLMVYNIMRGMGQHYTEDSEYPTQDGAFWTDSKRKDYAYFPEVHLPLLKKLFGKVCFILGKKLGSMKSMQVTYKK